MTAQEERLHATCVALRLRDAWHGVLFTGASGAGKSDLALRLIDRGARLVADDQVILCLDFGKNGAVEQRRLIASAPAALAGFMEWRGLGIFRGEFLPQALLSLHVSLVEESAVERLPEPRKTLYLGVGVPSFSLWARAASAPLLVEKALLALHDATPHTGALECA